jgi:hypothetical protein
VRGGGEGGHPAPAARAADEAEVSAGGDRNYRLRFIDIDDQTYLGDYEKLGESFLVDRLRFEHTERNRCIEGFA